MVVKALDGFNLLQTKGTAGHEERIFNLELPVSHFLLITMDMILQDAEHWNVNAAGPLTHHTSNLCVLGLQSCLKHLLVVFCSVLSTS